MQERHWRVKVMASIERLGQGRWRARWRDPSGRQKANSEHLAARQDGSVADQREMSEQARARAHTQRTSHYGQEPDYGEH
jgi:hypothetical protein